MDVNSTTISPDPHMQPTVQSSLAWSPRQIILAIGTVFVAWLISAIVRFVKYRKSYKELGPGLPSLPTTILFGTVPAMASLYKHSPVDTHPHGTMTLLWKKHKLGPLFYLDNWPAVGCRQMVIADPATAAQVIQAKSLPKHPMLRKFVEHICGPTSLLYTEGEAWKVPRSLFNPGFSAQHLMSLVPSIVQDTLIYCDILRDHARKGDLFQIEECLAHLTIDIMGHVVLDTDLNSQTEKNELAEAFRKAIDWTPSAVLINPLDKLNFIRPIMHWYYKKKMDNYIGRVIDERFTSRDASQMNITRKSKRKPAIDVALEEYAELTGNPNQKPDGAFMEMVIDQMKTFLFAGHDTSSSTMAYIYYLLGRHPEKLKKLRDELDHVFGADITKTADLLMEDPNLINKVPYCLAVVKETLRLFPPASTVRVGHPDVSINIDGIEYPTEGLLVWVSNHTIHRREDLFPQPDDFIPERFLPAPNNWQDIPKDAWRPFEKGPRGCIGQELALIETKVFMVLTLREFVFHEAYEDWDRKMGYEKPGEMLDGRRGMFGYRGYQVLKASAKPSEGMPGRMSFA